MTRVLAVWFIAIARAVRADGLLAHFGEEKRVVSGALGTACATSRPPAATFRPEGQTARSCVHSRFLGNDFYFEFRKVASVDVFDEKTG